MLANSLDFGRSRASRRRRHLLVIALLGVGFVVLFLMPSPASQAVSGAAALTGPVDLEVPSAPSTSGSGPAASTVPTLDLSVADTPNAICALEETSCPSGV